MRSNPYPIGPGGVSPDAADAVHDSRRANRRRLAVFLSMFVVVATIGLVWVYSRPAIYQATARLNLVVAESRAVPGAERSGDRRYALRDEVEFLTSRTLLAEVAQRLETAMPVPASSGEPAAVLQRMLTVTPLEGTTIIAVQAEGGEPRFVSALVDQVVASYRQSLAGRYRSTSAGALAEAEEEAQKLTAKVIEKRRLADAFRARHDIVSLERDENPTLAEVRGVGTALAAANEKVIAAESRLNAMESAQAAGQSAVRAKDNPGLAALEQQAAIVRNDLADVARTFTPQYMDIDPRVKSLRARLADLEKQIGQQRQTGQTSSLQEAREELAAARGAAARLRQQFAANQQSVQTFTSRFGEYRALQQELTDVEQMRQKAAARVVALEAEQLARMPRVEVLESAGVPQSPVRPLYTRDAALAVGLALVVALAMMALVELFNRPPRQPSTVLMPQAWVPVPMGNRPTGSLAMDVRTALADDIDEEPARLEPPRSMPRELTTDELESLIDAIDPELRPAVALLLMGLTRVEVVELRDADIDRDSGSIHVPGEASRRVEAPTAVVAALQPRDADGALFVRGDGRPLKEADLDAALLYAAHDAMLEVPEAINAEALRHTCIAFLLRQGMRFADVVKRVGHLDADVLAAYRRLASIAPRRAPEEIERWLPVVEGFGAR